VKADLGPEDDRRRSQGLSTSHTHHTNAVVLKGREAAPSNLDAKTTQDTKTTKVLCLAQRATRSGPFVAFVAFVSWVVFVLKDRGSATRRLGYRPPVRWSVWFVGRIRATPGRAA